MFHRNEFVKNRRKSHDSTDKIITDNASNKTIFLKPCFMVFVSDVNHNMQEAREMDDICTYPIHFFKIRDPNKNKLNSRYIEICVMHTLNKIRYFKECYDSHSTK